MWTNSETEIGKLIALTVNSFLSAQLVMAKKGMVNVFMQLWFSDLIL